MEKEYLEPKKVTEFKSEFYKAKYLMEHGFSKATAWGYRKVWYSGMYKSEPDPIPVEIVGVENGNSATALVIEVDGNFHCIHPDYLAEMQPPMPEVRKPLGKQVKKLLNNYVIFDIETTGLDISFDRIIEIAGLRIRDNKVVEQFREYINPGTDIKISKKITQMTGFTDEFLSDKPTFKEVEQKILDFFSDDVLVGHNINSFDLKMLANHMDCDLKNNFIDTLPLSRQAIKSPDEIPDHKLETIKEYLKVDEKSHEALGDCYTTKAIYDLCVRQKIDEKAFKEEKGKYGCEPHEKKLNTDYIKTNFTETTKELQQFKKILEDITADNKISDQEIDSLKRWMETHKELNGNYPFDKIDLEIDKILTDGIITSDEKRELLAVIDNFLKPANDDQVKVEFNGKVFVKTGNFEYGDEKKIKEYIESKGGIFQDKFSQKADYVVIGKYGSPAWSKGTFGSKVEQAKKFNDKPKANHHIFIITEKQLFDGEKL